MPDTLTGTIRLHRDFTSRFVTEKRDVIVYLPPGYDSSPQLRHPVLYLHDGQNLFDSATAFGGNDWRLRETMEDLLQRGAIGPLIIVGIYNTLNGLRNIRQCATGAGAEAVRAPMGS